MLVAERGTRALFSQWVAREMHVEYTMLERLSFVQLFDVCFPVRVSRVAVVVAHHV